MFVIVRYDGRGRPQYVAPSGSESSFTYNVNFARRFASREAAELERCPGNEQVVEIKYF